MNTHLDKGMILANRAITEQRVTRILEKAQVSLPRVNQTITKIKERKEGKKGVLTGDELKTLRLQTKDPTNPSSLKLVTNLHKEN